jgi:hypothetical protein
MGLLYVCLLFMNYPCCILFVCNIYKGGGNVKLNLTNLRYILWIPWFNYISQRVYTSIDETGPHSSFIIQFIILHS